MLHDKASARISAHQDPFHAGGISRGSNLEPVMIQFGSMPPMVVIELGEKVYMHQAQDPAQFQTVQSKKAQRREAAKAKKERRELMLEARALLKESTSADLKGDVEASQCLRTRAANRRARAASHHAPTPFPHLKPSRPAP